MDQIAYFPPGTLCSELMTIQRRWEIVSVTDDYIRQCKQFWIFDTDDYYQSWWTRSELMTLSYILDSDSQACPDIYVARPRLDEGELQFNVESYQTPEDKKKFLPVFDNEIRPELARFFANSRIGTVGYESQVPMQILNKAPKVAVWGMFLLSKQIQKKMLPKYSKERNQWRFSEYYKSVKSYVYTKSFWDEWVLECPVCKQKYFQGWNQEEFLYPLKALYCHKINEVNITFHSETDLWSYTCETCHHTYFFQMGHHYRWWTMRGDMQTSPNGTSIENLNTLYFVDEIFHGI